MKKRLLFFVFLLCGCTRITREDTPFVNYEVVRPIEVISNKTYQGFIDRALDVELSFGLSGIMNEIPALEGKFYKKGALLAKLDNEEYKLGISRAQSEFEDALVKYNRAKSYFERISKLHSAGGISFNDWEAAQTDLKSAKNQISISKDALDIAKNKETFSNIYAPYDGLVIKTFKDKNQFAAAGERVILFQGAGMPEARIFVSQEDINKINSGQEVTIFADSSNKTYRGVIKSKVETSINEGAYRVTVTILDDPKELLDGMSVNALIDFPPRKLVLIPMSAISSEGDENFVYVIENSRAAKRNIVTGGQKNGKIEIKSGLIFGEKVVTEGANKIMDGVKLNYD